MLLRNRYFIIKRKHRYQPEGWGKVQHLMFEGRCVEQTSRSAGVCRRPDSWESAPA